MLAKITSLVLKYKEAKRQSCHRLCFLFAHRRDREFNTSHTPVPLTKKLPTKLTRTVDGIQGLQFEEARRSERDDNDEPSELPGHGRIKLFVKAERSPHLSQVKDAVENKRKSTKGVLKLFGTTTIDLGTGEDAEGDEDDDSDEALQAFVDS